MRLIRILARPATVVVVLYVGLGLAAGLFGLALTRDSLSLRRFLARLEVWPGSDAVVGLHEALGDVLAHGLELALAIAGFGLAGYGCWRLLTSIAVFVSRQQRRGESPTRRSVVGDEGRRADRP